MLSKADAPKLKRFLGSLMRLHLGGLLVRDMVQLVKDMQWLSDIAEGLDQPQIEVKKMESLDKPKAKRNRKSPKPKAPAAVAKAEGK